MTIVRHGDMISRIKINPYQEIILNIGGQDIEELEADINGDIFFSPPIALISLQFHEIIIKTNIMKHLIQMILGLEILKILMNIII